MTYLLIIVTLVGARPEMTTEPFENRTICEYQAKKRVNAIKGGRAQAFCWRVSP